ncbi:gene transfer agent family protein [Tateyamaria sp. SN3-11]|uniref:gene transfer agent family protein n=1 Tax=Tateyamaria sp. SN3-11 TaxID=3092147 RepID=UPI0039E7411F
MDVTKFFGDADYTFALTDDMILEVERKTEMGIGALYLRMINTAFALRDLTEIIRLGLIGGGTSPEQAKALTTTYATNRPIAELLPLALDILDARFNGPEQEQKEEVDSDPIS